MRRKRNKGFSLSAEDARNALAVLVSEGRIAAQDVWKAIGRRQKLIAALRKRLEELGAEGAAMASRAARRARPVVSRSSRRVVRAGRKRATRALSAATRAAYQAQGRYMAAVRSLPEAVRKQIRAIREKSGVEAAIQAAKARAKKPIMRHTRNGS